jgi:hypothetical protein
MITSKCHICGYYFNGAVFSGCPRCSQGITGAVDSNFVSGSSGELGKGIQSRGLRIAAIVLAVIVVGGVVAASHKNSSDYSQVSASSDVSSSTDSSQTSDWMPSGYVSFDSNSDISYDPNFQSGTCQNANPNSGSGYCWQYQIATKSDCPVVTATLELTNSGSSIGTEVGEVDNTTAGQSTLLEIDAYDNSSVDGNTSGTITKIVCTATSSGGAEGVESPAPTDASGSVGGDTPATDPTDASGSLGN